MLMNVESAAASAVSGCCHIAGDGGVGERYRALRMNVNTAAVAESIRSPDRRRRRRIPGDGRVGDGCRTGDVDCAPVTAHRVVGEAGRVVGENRPVHDQPVARVETARVTGRRIAGDHTAVDGQ